MKKLIVTTLIISIATQYGIAEMRYNPLNNLIYSHPETLDISQDEYRMLLLGCIQIEARMIAMNAGKQPSKKDTIDQCCFYLNSVNSKTALRLIADLKNNTVNYANGSFMKKIFA